MVMGGPWATTTVRNSTAMAELDRLRLVQWLSPAFPIGAFAYSQGLEAAIAAGAVRDSATLQGWIAAVLTHGSGRLDAGFIALARAPDADLPALADLCRAMAGSAERLTEMMEQGRAFGRTIAAITGAIHEETVNLAGQPIDSKGSENVPARDAPSLPYALALGSASRALDVETPEVIMLYLQALAAQLTSVAVRFVPLGQTEGQIVLSRLAPLIARLAASHARMTLDDLSSTTMGADLAAMRHETMDVRIYRT
jgi:urease accessory protein